ncbi:MAG: hypothetical protein DMG92_15940 [Acidobacteria bacterium]|nr:MAG: hypothetical protein DMG92_15940 [Acidobacteriota bacterium]
MRVGIVGVTLRSGLHFADNCPTFSDREGAFHQLRKADIAVGTTLHDTLIFQLESDIGCGDVRFASTAR